MRRGRSRPRRCDGRAPQGRRPSRPWSGPHRPRPRPAGTGPPCARPPPGRVPEQQVVHQLPYVVLDARGRRRPSALRRGLQRRCSAKRRPRTRSGTSAVMQRGHAASYASPEQTRCAELRFALVTARPSASRCSPIEARAPRIVGAPRLPSSGNRQHGSPPARSEVPGGVGRAAPREPGIGIGVLRHRVDPPQHGATPTPW